MPHFRIIDEDAEEIQMCFDRARVHIRSAYRRRDEGKDYHAIATMYDALEYGLRWYLLKIQPDNPSDDRFFITKAFSHVDLPSSMIERVVEIIDNLMDSDEEVVNSEIVTEFFEISERVLTHLELYPFNFSVLPDEFPGIY